MEEGQICIIQSPKGRAGVCTLSGSDLPNGPSCPQCRHEIRTSHLNEPDSAKTTGPISQQESSKTVLANQQSRLDYLVSKKKPIANQTDGSVKVFHKRHITANLQSAPFLSTMGLITGMKQWVLGCEKPFPVAHTLTQTCEEKLFGSMYPAVA